MKRIFRIFCLSTGLTFAWLAGVAISYDDFFTDQGLRYDFLLAGNQTRVQVLECQVLQELHWAGPRTELVQLRDIGTYRYRVLDAASQMLIFSRGFCPLFQEWQTTPEAKKMDRAFYQSVFFPFPKKEVVLVIEQRDRDGKFQPVHQASIKPDDYFIRRERPVDPDLTEIVTNGKPENHVDVLFLPEGYAEGEREQFLSDVRRLSSDLLAASPFADRKEAFNVRAVWTPSDDSGTDIPGEHLYANTRYNSTFYTFDIDRYLTTGDMKSVYDAASAVPWDHIILLVNTERYGGGGFYNFLTVCTSDHLLSPKVLVHEFGHAFGGLGDEYYTSSVAYEDYYNLAVEPWEPNLTTLVGFESKWKGMIKTGTPVPTPRTADYANEVGVFEGGGYMSKGIFSPMQDCRMKSNNTDEFCPVCKKAILEAMDEYTR